MEPLKHLAQLLSFEFPGKVLPNAFDENFLSENMLLNLIGKLTLKDLEIGLRPRVYLDGVYSPDQVPRLVNTPPLIDDNFKSWTERLFGDKEFLIIINNCEYLFLNMTESIFENYVRFLPSSVTDEALFKGVDIVLLIGKYKNSPLALHNDPDRLSIVHFQVLGEKRLSYFSHLDDPTPERILSMKPGEAITFGGSHYHLGHAPSLSVSVTLGVSRFGFTDMYGELASLMARDLEINQIRDLPGVKYPTREQFHKGLEHLGSESYLQKMHEAIEDYNLSLRSNLFFIGPSKFNTRKMSENFRQSFLRLRRPNAISFLKRGDILKIFIRKHQIKLSASEDVLKLLQRLNNYESVAINEMVKEMTLFNLLCGLDVCDFTS